MTKPDAQPKHMKKKQVIVIHGGTTFKTRKEYLNYLRNCKITLEKFKPKKDWKIGMGKILGNGFEVLLPKMPNKVNARYKEWKIWFERILTVTNNNIILIGHSLGGIFLAKYLSENLVSKKIIATFLVAAPFDDNGEKEKESLADFSLPKSLKKFEKQGGKIYLYHSKNDPVVSISHFEKYSKILPNARATVLKNRAHFNKEQFPEILKEIKRLFK